MIYEGYKIGFLKI